MKWLIDNWSLLVLLIVVVILVIRFLKKFSEMPSDTQITKVKEWLLYAVVLAEKDFGGGTGALKLRYVYNLFIDKFPSFAPIVSFDLFSSWVDEALEKMKHLLETNKNIEAYVEGDE